MMGIFSSVKDKITGYIDTRVRLIKLNLIGHTARVMSFIFFALVTLFIIFAIILFLGFGLTEVFVANGFERYAAMFITVGIYVGLLVIVLLLRKPFTKFFAGTVINVMTENGEDDEEKKAE